METQSRKEMTKGRLFVQGRLSLGPVAYLLSSLGPLGARGKLTFHSP